MAGEGALSNQSKEDGTDLKGQPGASTSIANGDSQAANVCKNDLIHFLSF